MEEPIKNGTKTRKNWIIDVILSLFALVSILSGIYFLYLPDGGFKGGRNPLYGIKILFERETWEWMHTWISLALVAIALVHLLLHWGWVRSTVKKFFTKTLINRANRQNAAVDLILILSFVICALSGIYLFIAPEVKGSLTVDPIFLFSRTGWDMLHTWSGVVFIGSSIIHLVLHWRWVESVTRKMFSSKRSLELVRVSSEH